ncbi:MAG: acyltransferase domain-containing protein [Gammaproteobacteria bacterium]|nr:acyltransferase domain-containing protein [Gammaproteobacteria bacterium]
MSENTAFLFPGQGSQYPGMGRDLFETYPQVRETYSEASEALGYDLPHLCFEDQDGSIHLTRFTQPALLTHSIACYRLFSGLSGGRIQPVAAAGHSLGEYSALICAGVLDFAEALKLVKSRGELMGEYGEGEMEVLMLDLESAQLLADRHVCGIAACNLPEQTVVGGRAEDLDALVKDMAGRFPKRRSARLKTEGAFHTFYMVEAGKRFREELAQTAFMTSEIKVLSNYSGRVHDNEAESIRARLFFQLFNPVLWHSNLLTLQELEVTRIIEFGGGIGKGATPAEKRPNLEAMIKKAYRDQDLIYAPVINQETLEEAVERFQD